MKPKIILRDFRRRYREPVIKALFRLFSRLPLSLSFRAGGLIGRILWLYNGEMRQVAQKNIDLCFPDWNEEKRKALCKQSLLETGKNITEVPALWCWDESAILSLVHQVSGEEQIKNAFDNGRSVIILAPHLGAWEMVGLYLSIRYKMTSMYRPPEMTGLEHIVREGRSRFGANLVPTDTGGVRNLLAALKNREMIGVLPDQDPGRAGGEFAPFYQVLANTVTFTSKLAQKTDADVIACYAKRDTEKKGYDLFFEPANKAINDKNMAISLAALNLETEKLINQCPEQYQWSYKRFKTRPEGENSFYQ